MFNSYEELKAAVEERRKAVLTLEIELGGAYSPEHEEAKQALATAKAMKQLSGGGFLAGDGTAELEARVAETKPETPTVWVQYKQLELAEWSALMKQTNLSAMDQYERVLPKTFIGVFGRDPVPDEKPEGWEEPTPLTTDARSVSSRGGTESILPGGALHSVVQSFMAWQNSGGDVTIRPTKSGRA